MNILQKASLFLCLIKGWNRLFNRAGAKDGSFPLETKTLPGACLVKLRLKRKGLSSFGFLPSIRMLVVLILVSCYFEPRIISSKIAFWACILLPACSNTILALPSIIEPVTSSPLWAGRQCMNLQCFGALLNKRSLIWKSLNF